MKNNCFAYMKFSEKDDKRKHAILLQDIALTKYSEKHNFEYTNMFCDNTTQKLTRNVSNWQKLENILQKGDTIVFKDISRFIPDAKQGYPKYMELYNKGISLIFLDNPSINTLFIKRMIDIAKEEKLIFQKSTFESIIKLLLMTELDKEKQEKIMISEKIKNGIKLSNKTQGRKIGQLDKMTEQLEKDIKMYLNDRTIKQVDLMKKHNISRNTLKKYVEIVRQKNNVK